MTSGDVRVVGLGGSLAATSASLAALDAALDGAREAGAAVSRFSVRELDLPHYRPDLAAPAQVEALCDAVEAAHGMIWSSPLYHGTVSGSFKNAVDWLQVLAQRGVPYLADKVVGLVATSGGVQGLQAINTMEFIVRSLRGWAVPLVIAVPSASQAFDAEANIVDRSVAGQLVGLGAEVARAARQLAAQGTCDYSDEDPAPGR